MAQLWGNEFYQKLMILWITHATGYLFFFIFALYIMSKNIHNYSLFFVESQVCAVLQQVDCSSFGIYIESYQQKLTQEVVWVLIIRSKLCLISIIPSCSLFSSSLLALWHSIILSSISSRSIVCSRLNR